MLRRSKIKVTNGVALRLSVVTSTIEYTFIFSTTENLSGVSKRVWDFLVLKSSLLPFVLAFRSAFGVRK